MCRSERARGRPLLRALDWLLRRPQNQDSSDPQLLEGIMRANHLVAEIRLGPMPSGALGASTSGTPRASAIAPRTMTVGL